MSGNKVQEVLSALQVLHTAGPTYAEADQWLRRFQRTPEAWTVADQMLHAGELHEQAHYFAAHTLRTKLLYDYDELVKNADENARMSFRDSLLQHIVRYKDGSAAIRTQLCLSLGSLVVCMPEWNDPLDFLLTSLGASPETAVLLLQVLTVVPEECSNMKLSVTNVQRENVYQYCARFSSRILEILLTYMQSTGDNRDLQIKVLHCFNSWVRHGGIGAAELSGSPFLPLVFEGVQVPELFEVCVDTIVSLIRHTENMQTYDAVCQQMITRTLTLAPRLEQAVHEGDSDTVNDLARIFIAIGENYVRFIVGASDEAFQVLRCVLLSTSYTNDMDVATMSFNLWYILCQSLYGYMGQANCGSYFDVLMKLLEVLIRLMTYPQAYDSWTKDERDDGKKHRYESGYLMMDVVSVLGVDKCLRFLSQMLETRLGAYRQNPERWHDLEAVLYGIRALGKKVPNNESTYMPNILRILPEISTGTASSPPGAQPGAGFQALPTLTMHPALQYTCTLIVGRYADWVALHQEYVHSLFPFVLAGFKNPDTEASSALAFKNLCDGCNMLFAVSSAMGAPAWPAHLSLPPPRHTYPYMDALFDVYEGMRPGLPMDDQSEVIEGLALVISAITDEHDMRIYLQRLMLPMMKVVQPAIVTPQPPSSPASAFVEAMSRICEVWKSMDYFGNPNNPAPDRNQVVPRTCMVVFNEMWPSLEQVFVHYKSSTDVMSLATAGFKYLIRGVMGFFLPVLPQFLNVVCSSYEAVPLPAFLYSLNVCVDVFSSSDYSNHGGVGGVVGAVGTGLEPGFAELVGQCLVRVCSRTFTILTNEEAFIAMPDLVYDFFSLVSRYLAKCPSVPLSRPALVGSLIQCALQGVFVQHKEACMSVMSFIGSLVDAGSASAPSPSVSGSLSAGAPSSAAVGSDMDVKAAVSALLQEYGPMLVLRLTSALTWRLPMMRVKYVIGALVPLRRFVGDATIRAWTERALHQVIADMQASQEVQTVASEVTAHATVFFEAFFRADASDNRETRKVCLAFANDVRRAIKT